MKKAALLHLSNHMWQKKGSLSQPYKHFADFGWFDTLKCDKKTWTDITDYMAKSGFDTVVIDLGDGVIFDSHPEIAIEGAWTKAELREELSRLRSIGLTPIPKFNLSNGHSAWLHDYAYTVGTDIYDTVCCDLINEAIELFDTPEFFHLGMEEEDYGSQKGQPVAIMRCPENKTRDCLMFCNTCRAKGVRPWIWIDDHTIEAFGGEEEFCKNFDKDLLVSTWYYGSIKVNDTEHPQVKFMQKISDWGYEQIVTGSTWSWHLNMKNLMRAGKYKVQNSTVKGYMMASWMLTIPEKYYAHLDSFDNFRYAFEDIYGGDE
ncbi:MAG: hypothetical protein IJ408_04345 [Clostridia bacterium]|nr:hypothetical protein [Clostridia bacterium]